MGSCYTNVYMPDRFNQMDSFIEQIELLKFEKSRLQKKLDYHHDVFDNIPAAIIKYGYIDLHYDKDKVMKIGVVK